MAFWSFFIVLLWIRISQNHYFQGSGRVLKSFAFASRLKNFSTTLIEILIRNWIQSQSHNNKIQLILFFPGLLSFLVLVYRVVIIFSPYIRAFVLRLRYRRVKRECIGKIIYIKNLKCAQIWPKMEFIYWSYLNFLPFEWQLQLLLNSLLMQCETKIRFLYWEPKPRSNFGISFGAKIYFSKTETLFFKFFSFFPTSWGIEVL